MSFFSVQDILEFFLATQILFALPFFFVFFLLLLLLAATGGIICLAWPTHLPSQMRPWWICMTVPFFHIGHACPVQRSYELFLRVEILLSHIFSFSFFFHLPPAHLSLVCLVIFFSLDVSPSHTLYYLILLSSFSFLLTSLFVLFFFTTSPNPLLATRCVITWGNTQPSHPTEPNFFFFFFFWRISLVGGVVPFFFVCACILCLCLFFFFHVFQYGLQPRRLWPQHPLPVFFAWIFNGKKSRG